MAAKKKRERKKKKRTVTGAGEDGEERETCAPPVGMQNGPVTVENSTAAPPQKGT